MKRECKNPPTPFDTILIWQTNDNPKPHLIFTKKTWLKAAEIKHPFMSNFTVEEIENYNKDTGLIGNSCGIDCYVSKSWDEILK